MTSDIPQLTFVPNGLGCHPLIEVEGELYELNTPLTRSTENLGDRSNSFHSDQSYASTLFKTQDGQEATQDDGSSSATKQGADSSITKSLPENVQTKTVNSANTTSSVSANLHRSNMITARVDPNITGNHLKEPEAGKSNDIFEVSNNEAQGVRSKITTNKKGKAATVEDDDSSYTECSQHTFSQDSGWESRDTVQPQDTTARNSSDPAFSNFEESSNSVPTGLLSYYSHNLSCRPKSDWYSMSDWNSMSARSRRSLQLEDLRISGAAFRIDEICQLIARYKVYGEHAKAILENIHREVESGKLIQGTDEHADLYYFAEQNEENQMIHHQNKAHSEYEMIGGLLWWNEMAVPELNRVSALRAELNGGSPLKFATIGPAAQRLFSDFPYAKRSGTVCGSVATDNGTIRNIPQAPSSFAPSRTEEEYDVQSEGKAKAPLRYQFPMPITSSQDNSVAGSYSSYKSQSNIDESEEVILSQLLKDSVADSNKSATTTQTPEIRGKSATTRSRKYGRGIPYQRTPPSSGIAPGRMILGWPNEHNSEIARYETSSEERYYIRRLMEELSPYHVADLLREIEILLAFDESPLAPQIWREIYLRTGGTPLEKHAAYDAYIATLSTMEADSPPSIKKARPDLFSLDETSKSDVSDSRQPSRRNNANQPIEISSENRRKIYQILRTMKGRPWVSIFLEIVMAVGPDAARFTPRIFNQLLKEPGSDEIYGISVLMGERFPKHTDWKTLKYFIKRALSAQSI